MDTLIPTRYRTIIGTIVTLVVAILAVVMEWQDLGQTAVLWVGRAFALLLVISNVLGLRVAVPGRPAPTVAPRRRA